MKISLLTLLGLLAFATAQDVQVVDTTGIDPALLILPGEGIDFEGCYSDLNRNDVDRDGGVRQNEFLGFVQDYAKRKCLTNDALSLKQFAAFNSLSCYCASVEGQDGSCCLGENGLIDTGGSLTPASRTEPQIQYLIYVCITVDNTLPESACQPDILDRGTPPPVETIFLPAGGIPRGQAEEPEDDNVWDWLKWLLIALAILLLLCCCCCCTFRRRRLAAIAEEEEREAAAAAQAKSMDVEQAPEQFPVDEYNTTTESIPYPDEEVVEYITEPAVMVAAAAADDEDGRRARGGHNLPDEDDEEARRLRGAGQLPPPNDPNPNGMKLRSIPPKDPEDPDEWDHPGRDINFPKPPPKEHEAGFDHDEIDGGVYLPERDPQEPGSPYKANWERLKKEAPDESDMRKRRIQTGLGEGEVWNALGEDNDDDKGKSAPSGDIFDWVVSSALGVLDKSAEDGHLSS